MQQIAPSLLPAVPMKFKQLAHGTDHAASLARSGIRRAMKPLSQQLKQALAALACADAGEMLSRDDMGRMLGDAPTAETAGREGRREVVMGLGDLLSGRVIRYALGVCQRLDADLCILAEDVDAAYRQLDPYRAQWQQAGIRCRTEVVAGTRGVRAFFDRHPQVLFAVSGGNDPLTAAFAGRRNTKPPVPLVLVDDGPPTELRPPALAYAAD